MNGDGHGDGAGRRPRGQGRGTWEDQNFLSLFEVTLAACFDPAGEGLGRGPSWPLLSTPPHPCSSRSGAGMRTGQWGGTHREASPGKRAAFAGGPQETEAAEWTHVTVPAARERSTTGSKEAAASGPQEGSGGRAGRGTGHLAIPGRWGGGRQPLATPRTRSWHGAVGVVAGSGWTRPAMSPRGMCEAQLWTEVKVGWTRY